MIRKAVLLLALPLLLSGFTGNVGPESEFYVGVGIGQIKTEMDNDRYGEIGGTWRYKFRHHPYDHTAPWVQFGLSWSTYPEGGMLGNQIWAIQYMGGFVKTYVEFGAGFVLTGDQTGIGPMFPLPSFRLRLGPHDKIQFGVGVMDEAPYWSSGGVLHFEAIVTAPFEKVWAPKLKIGGRMNLYAPFERTPIELFGGVEARLGRHVRVAIEGSLGDGGTFGGEPSFTLVAKVGGAVGPGTKSDRRPQPPR